MGGWGYIQLVHWTKQVQSFKEGAEFYVVFCCVCNLLKICLRSAPTCSAVGASIHCQQVGVEFTVIALLLSFSCSLGKFSIACIIQSLT